MSIHFAPQWVKPIKPSGTSLTPTTETPSGGITSIGAGGGGLKSTVSSAIGSGPSPSVPFPALSGGRASPNTSTTANPALSYSRVTHTPLSPSFPGDASYFPYQEPNLNKENGAHPFRYSREQILALFDESKYKETPIELVEMAEGGGVLVSKSMNRPVGLRDLTDIEKKLLATSIHPPMPNRRQGTHTAVTPANPAEPATPNGIPSRRGVGFARGEGGAFGGSLGGKIGGTIGGGMLSPGGLESKAPGALGGGFGGVSKRLGRVRNEAGDAAAEGPRATGPNWRPPRTASGNFEGVLGFGSTTPSAITAVNPLSPSVDSHDAQDAAGRLRNGDAARSKVEGGEEKRDEDMSKFGKGGGPGWGTGQKKWRVAAGLTPRGEGDRTLDVPISAEPSSASVIATPSATPVPERDATVLESAAAPIAPRLDGSQDQSQTQTQPEEKQDLGSVEWFYRDPNGQEQGPFTGTQMHDWYSQSYFTDDLPLRRASETSFQPLSELKVVTGNAVQPFLSPVRPRLPPNLPIPVAALQQNGHIGALPDAFRNLGVSSPIAVDPRISPQPPLQPIPQPFNQGFLPERNAFAPQTPGYAPAFANPIGSPGAFGPGPGPVWNGASPGGPRLNGPFGSIGMPSPIGQAPMPFIQQQHQQQYFSPQIGSPVRAGDIFSPSVGVGAIPPSPWGAPQHHPHQGYHQPPVPPQQQQPSPMPAWPVESTQSQVPAQTESKPDLAIEQAIAEALAPVATEGSEEQIEQPAAVAATDVEAKEVETLHEDAPAAQEESIEEPEAEAEVIAAPAAKAPVQSVWANNASASKPSSRKASIAEPSTPSTPASLAPTPADAAKTPAPAKATAAAAKQFSTTDGPTTAPKTVAPATPGPTTTTSALATPTTEKAPVSNKPAPWAIKDDKETKVPTGPSLREIQEAEAKKAEARKRQVLAEARAASASPAPLPSASIDDFPTTMSWGLPSSNKGAAAPASASPATPSTPVAPAWGGGDAALAGKKTLKQIQEEEEKRKAKAAQAARAAQAAVGGATPAGQKRGYADLAATQTAPAAGWTTVGASGKTAASAVTATPPAAARTVSAANVVKAATPVKATPTMTASIVAPKRDEPASNGSAAAAGQPSVEFIRWTKQALTGFKGDVDDFIQVLLSFPVDIPAANRSDTLEIISDSVYANSSTLDGRRFAQEFYTRRKADAARPSATAAGKGGVAKISSLADVVKTQPVKKGEDFGFKVVKGKGKKKN
ncbi:hypothetical protein IAU60_006139 [Kwoniella sp. DSM 27419]